MKQLRDALAKSISDKLASEERLQKEVERVKAELDRKLISQRRSFMFDINHWKDAHDTVAMRCVNAYIHTYIYIYIYTYIYKPPPPSLLSLLYYILYMYMYV